MKPLVWRDEYSVGNPQCDEQHKRMFSIINDLLDHFEQKTENEAIPAILDRLKEYALTHFSCEEDIFESSSYPDIHTHKKAHQLYRDQIISFLDRWNTENHDTLVREILEFVETWWIAHIQNTDRKYTPYISKK